MGACFSCKSQSTFNNIRLVHLSGYVESLDPPTTVIQVTGKPAKHFVFTPSQLLSPDSKPLKPDTLLEPGHIYLLLPYSALRADVSPMDLASLARKLTAVAKTSRCDEAKCARAAGSLNQVWSSPVHCSSPVWNEMARSPGRSPMSRSWKPLLDTIREKSFSRRSESELQENQVEAAR